MNDKILEFVACYVYNKFFSETKCQMTIVNQSDKISVALDLKDLGKIQLIISKDEWFIIQEKVTTKLTNKDITKLNYIIEIMSYPMDFYELQLQLKAQIYNIRTLIRIDQYTHSIDIPPKLLLWVTHAK